MAVIAAADINSIIDECVQFYLRALGTNASGYGIGTAGAAWGAAGSVQDIEAVLLAMTDLDPVGDLVATVRNLIVYTSGANYAGNQLSPLLSALQQHIARYNANGARTLDEYLTYLNTGTVTKWQALQHPSWYDVFGVFIAGMTPAVNNVYFEVLEGATYANALAKLVVAGAVFTDGFAIDETMYCGGFPKVKATGTTGAGIVTVTGSAYNPATKAVVTGVTWTVNVNADNTFVLAPGTAPADSLITNVSGIGAAAGLTAGTLYIESHRPTGRPVLP